MFMTANLASFEYLLTSDFTFLRFVGGKAVPVLERKRSVVIGNPEVVMKLYHPGETPDVPLSENIFVFSSFRLAHVCDPITEFACNKSLCISRELYCDGVPNCPEGEDEISCSSYNDDQFSIKEKLASLTNNFTSQSRLLKPDCEEKFSCSNGNCVFFSQVCDWNDSCGDESDERICNKTKRQLIMNDGHSFIEQSHLGKQKT